MSDFENLQVLASCDFQKMDRMVQDLTNALDETEKPSPKSPRSHIHAPAGKVSKKHVCVGKKRLCKKRKSTQNIWEYGNLSEASESSLDEAFRDYIESVPRGSDSDEFVFTVNRLQLLATFANTALSLAESDSFNETISPMRVQAQRRRRRLRRMAVDPDPDSSIVDDKKDKSKDSARLAADDEDLDCEDAGSMDGSSDTLPGKRKRETRDKGGNTYDLEHEGDGHVAGTDESHMECSNNSG